MVKLIWTNEAKWWFKEIHDYIQLDNPSASKTTLRNIRENAKTLTSYPSIGYHYQHKGGDVRIVLYGHYRIVYIYDNQKVYILGIFHGALDLNRHLKMPIH